MADANELRKIAACGRVFSPAAPVNKFQLFKGRKDQLQSVISAITTRGKHVVLFGDRGVGKTSLANILKDALGAQDSVEVVKANCNESDFYVDVWRRALSDVTMFAEMPDDSGGTNTVEYALSQWITPDLPFGSGEIKKILGLKCSEAHELVVIFDEVDRLTAEQRRFFADTIKDLSDSSTNVTVMLIGVAHTLTELIAEHRSIERCLSQVYMPPMDKYELREIISTGLKSLGMKIEPDARDVIISLSRGYPYYTHLLCYEACVKAIKAHTDEIKRADVNGAIKVALGNALASVREDYSKAADGQRKGTNFPQVLLACAMAATDDLGYFKPADLRWPTEEDREPDFSEHLNKLATDETRGQVLERWGTPRKYRFRFRNPLLKPYIIMKGMSEGKVPGGLLDGLGVDRPQPKDLFDVVE